MNRLPYEMEVPKGYEAWKRRELKRRKKAMDLRKKFEKDTEYKTKEYIS